MPRILSSTLLLTAVLAVTARAQSGQGILFVEDFEAYSAHSLLDGQGGWTGYDGSDHAVATVVPGAGRNGSQGLVIAATDGPFRSDSYGLELSLDSPPGGLYWVQFHYRAPAQEDWLAGICFRAGHTEVNVTATEAWVTWQNDWWRIHREVEHEPDPWHTVTLAFSAELNVYAAWLDGVRLGEGLPLIRQWYADRLYLGGAGTEAAPLVIDDLVVTRARPRDVPAQFLLPRSQPGLRFRFAALGDPQQGLSSYEQNLEQLRMAVEQVGWADPTLTLVLGDLVHEADDETAYADVQSALDGLPGGRGSYHAVRGNHDRRDLFRTYFSDSLDYAVTHDGVRFIFLDAVGPGDVDPPMGGYQGLTEEQLAWVEAELAAAVLAGQEVVLSTHVSPWQDNPLGGAPYYQIGPGRDALVDLIDAYGVTLVLSGHYHKALWHHEDGGTHYLVLPGTARAWEGTLGWALVEVYEDRFEVYHKPIFAAFERDGVADFYNYWQGAWLSYEAASASDPHLAWGPITIERRRPTSAPPSGSLREAPDVAALRVAGPNPTQGPTQLVFSLAKPSAARVSLFDALGREVAVLAEGPFEAGAHRVTLDGSRLAGGVYAARLETGRVTATVTITVLK